MINHDNTLDQDAANYFFDTQSTDYISYHVVYSLESDELMLTASTIPLTEGVYYPVFSFKAGRTVNCVYLGVL